MLLGTMLGCESYESVKSKEEYSVLQVVEYEHRGTSVSGVQIVERQGYRIAGFRSERGDGNVWILLDPRHAPHYKQVPEAPFKISTADLEIVRRTPSVSREVLAALEARVSRESS